MKITFQSILYALLAVVLGTLIYQMIESPPPAGKSLGWYPIYKKDPRTGFCFAMAGGGPSSIVTTVPCTNMVEFLIEQSGGEPVSEQTTK